MSLREQGLRESLRAQGLKQGGLRGSLRNLNSTGPDIPDSAIYRWPFDEGSGNTTTDTVVNQDATINGAVWVSGPGDGGFHLDFDGSDDFVDTNVVPVTGSQNRTVAMWINPDVASSGDYNLTAWGTASGGRRWRFLIRDGGLRIEIGGSGETTALSPATGSWQPVACVLDGSTFGDHRLYFDGNTESVSGSAGVNTGGFNTAYIGESPISTGYFDGGIDDPVFWDRSLTTSELDDWASATQGNYS